VVDAGVDQLVARREETVEISGECGFLWAPAATHSTLEFLDGGRQ